MIFWDGSINVIFARIPTKDSRKAENVTVCVNQQNLPKNLRKWSGVKMCRTCRSKNILQKKYSLLHLEHFNINLFAEVGFDTFENEPFKDC